MVGRNLSLLLLNCVPGPGLTIFTNLLSHLCGLQRFISDQIGQLVDFQSGTLVPYYEPHAEAWLVLVTATLPVRRHRRRVGIPAFPSLLPILRNVV